MLLHLSTRRWFFDHPDYGWRIFTDRVPNVALRYVHCTTRLATIGLVFDVALGSATGARLLDELRIALSGDTLRRTVRIMASPVTINP